MDDVSYAYFWSFHKADEQKEPLSTIFNVTTYPVVPHPPSTKNSQVGAGGDKTDLGSTTNQAKNEGTRSVKWNDYIEKFWSINLYLKNPSNRNHGQMMPRMMTTSCFPDGDDISEG